MTHLSRILLNPRHRYVQRDLSDCQSLHQTVLSGFPDLRGAVSPRAHLGVLYRLETDRLLPCLLVQSSVAPTWDRLPAGYLAVTDQDNPASKCVTKAYAALSPGQELVFQLRANPTRKIETKSGPRGERRNGKRVPVRGDEARLQWLHGKGVSAGFELLTVRSAPAVPDVRDNPGQQLTGKRRVDGGTPEKLTFDAVTFTGRLRITEVDAFRRTLVEGIGSGKAYGFGLLSIGPA